jgi:hypothetical protein
VKLVEGVNKIMRASGLAYCQSLSFRAPDVALYLRSVETCIDLRGVAIESEHMTKCRGTSG